MVISDPVSNCNFIFILLIVTKTNFLSGPVSSDNLQIFFFSFVDFTLLTYFLFPLHFLDLQQVF